MPPTYAGVSLAAWTARAARWHESVIDPAEYRPADQVGGPPDLRHLAPRGRADRAAAGAARRSVLAGGVRPVRGHHFAATAGLLAAVRTALAAGSDSDPRNTLVIQAKRPDGTPGEAVSARMHLLPPRPLAGPRPWRGDTADPSPYGPATGPAPSPSQLRRAVAAAGAATGRACDWPNTTSAGPSLGAWTWCSAGPCPWRWRPASTPTPESA